MGIGWSWFLWPLRARASLCVLVFYTSKSHDWFQPGHLLGGPSALSDAICVTEEAYVRAYAQKERRNPYEESSSFLRRDRRCGCRPGFSYLLHHSRDLSPAHHDASAGFASNACCGLFHPSHHLCCRGPGDPSEISEKVVARATRE